LKKVCIVANSNLKHVSLISLYTNILDKHKITYDIIYIERYGIKEKSNARKLYPFYLQFSGGKINKIKGFLKFRRFAKKIIKENKYDFIITWQATTAYILFDFLISKYKNRYCLNIRDYIMEKKLPIRLILNPLLKFSTFATISSKSFTDFLPKHNYILINSINDDIITNSTRNKKSKKTSIEYPIKIGFVGNCRFFDENIKLINALKNNKKYELWFCGTNSEYLEEYAKKNEISNVITTGSFAVEETEKIMSQFDLINSAFGNEHINVKTLTPIRLYTAIGLYIPIIVNDKTQLSNIVKENKIGFIIKSYDNLDKNIENYMKELKSENFVKNCDNFLKKSREENLIFEETIKKILLEKEV